MLNTKYSQLAEILNQEPTVLSWHMLELHPVSGTTEIVIYAVLATGYSLKSVQTNIASRSATTLPSCYWVSLLNLPVMDDGVLDISVLKQQAVLEASYLPLWESIIKESTAINDVALVVQDIGEPLTYLHLSEVLPEKLLPSLEQIPKSNVTDCTVGTVVDDKISKSSLLIGESLLLSAEQAMTLSCILQRNAITFQGERLIFIDHAGNEERYSYKLLLNEAEATLAGFCQAGLQPKDKVILQLRDNKNILIAFWACILGGFIPVIISPPQSYQEENNDLTRLVHVFQHLQHPFILVDKSLQEEVNGLSSYCEFDSKHKLVFETLNCRQADTEYYLAKPHDIAFFTLTSGSTGKPKCIALTHYNLIMRALGTNQANQHQPDDIILNWLPFDHIGSISDWHIRCIILGCKQVYVPKEYVLGQPLNWLNLINDYRISHSWAPNFAYALIINALQDYSGYSEWDLSCVKALLSAGEAVSPTTVASFLQSLSCFGFPAQAIRPAFGMAEMGSGVTYFQACAQHPLRFMTLSRASLNSAEGVREVAASDPQAISLTSLGEPIPGISLRIVDPQQNVLSMGQLGRLQVKGDAVASGYYCNPAATAEAFLHDAWFDTGDLAFFSAGELFIAGRAKEVIIINGANFASAEIEAVVEQVAGVSISFTAACGVRMPGCQLEELAIFFSPLKHSNEALAAVLIKIEAALLKALGLMPNYLIPLRHDAIPKTAIGKIQRKQLAQRLEVGDYDSVLKKVDCLLGNARTVPDWFYERVWQCRMPYTPSSAATTTGVHVLLADEHGLAETLAVKLRALGNSCHLVRPEQALSTALFTALDGPLIQVWHLQHYTPYAGELNVNTLEQLELAQQEGIYRLLELVKILDKVLAAQDQQPHIGLAVVASHVQSVMPEDDLACEKAPLFAWLKSAATEYAWLRCRHIDLPFCELQQTSDYLLAEYTSQDHESAIAWRNGKRYVMRLQKAVLQANQFETLRFEEGGFYLLTGGLGGIGVEIARFLLTNYAAHLLLVGQTPLTVESNRDLADEKITARLAAFESLQTLPGDLQYHVIDVTDPNALEQAVCEVEAHWDKCLSGIIHLAGTSREQALPDETEQGVAATLRPKVVGAMAVQQLLNSRPAAFSLFFSSIAAYFGGASISAYSAANAFLDYFAMQQQAQAKRSYSLAWSMWDNIGMSHGAGVQKVFAAKGYCLVSVEEGLRSLCVALAQRKASLLIGLDGGKPTVRAQRQDVAINAQQLLACYVPTDMDVSTRTLRETHEPFLLDRFGTPSPCQFVEMDALPRSEAGILDKDKLLRSLAHEQQAESVNYVAPRSPLEKQLVAIWQGVLQNKKVGILDNFFTLGGASLQAIQCIAQLNQVLALDLPPSALFTYPTIELLSTHIQSQSSPAIATSTRLIQPRAPEEPLLSSFAQQRLWFLDALEAGEAYNIPVALRLYGAFDLEAFQAAFNAVLQRHEVLRTRFIKGTQYLQLDDTVPPPLNIIDLSQLNPAAQASAVMRHIRDDAQGRFDLEQDDLLRGTILYLAADEYVLLLNLHHIAGDGWSISLLAHELSTLYQDFQAGRAVSLSDLPIQYADFAAWQRRSLQGERLNELLSFWKNQLAGAPELLQLPTDFPRPEVDSYYGAQHTIHIPKAVTDELRQLAERSNATLYMTLMAAFNVLLYRYSGQEDLVVGSPVACRQHAELESLIGFFANTLALRTHLDETISFEQLLLQVKQTAQAAYDHQEVPFEKLVEELKPSRSLAYNPLVQVLFALQNVSLHEFEFQGVQTEPLALAGERVLFDLELQLWETKNGLEGYLLYKTSLFQAATIERMAQHLLNLLSAMLANPSQAISRLPLIAEAERRKILQDWSGVAQQATAKASVVQLFEQQAALTPDALAAIFPLLSDRNSFTPNTIKLSYHDLNARANRIAHYLHQLGVKPEMPVGLCVNRSSDLLIGLLGILKSGAVYLPIDPDYPAERIQFMLNDAQAAFLLSQQTIVDTLSANQALPDQLTVLCLDKAESILKAQPSYDRSHAIQANQLAYIIYTSGSTGHPKGVMVEQATLASHIHAMCQHFDLSAQDNVWQFASISFDVALEQILSPLSCGACLVMGQTDWPLDSVDEQLRTQGITVFDLPPAYLDALLAMWQDKQDMPSELRLMIVGNDILPPSTVARWRALPCRHVRLLNAYGPTETTITASYYAVPYQTECMEHNLPIGRPVQGKTAYILDQHLQPVPAGVPAELYIGGNGLARGYLNRSDLSADKFISNPFAAGRLYKTGDRACWLANGDIAFLGRIDHQVKLRGFRIELGEIEAALQQHEMVKEAAVIVREDSSKQKQLVAYVSPQIETAKPTHLLDKLRLQLSSKLPHYMQPAHIISLSALPKTANGKINRQALPAPSSINSRTESEEAELSPLEKSLATIWMELLKLPQVNGDDNFFALGGDSILSLQMVWKAGQQGIRITPQQVFQHQTVTALAQVANIAVASSAEQKPVSGTVPLTPIQHWFFDLKWACPTHYNQYVCLDILPQVKPDALEQALAALHYHHDALRLRFELASNTWTQTCTAPHASEHLVVFDLSVMEPLERESFMQAQIEYYQQSLQLSSGPLTQALLFKRNDDQAPRLVWIVHHLLVDGVSWRILLADLETAYQQRLQAQSVALPAKTTSFKQWSEWLHHDGVAAVRHELAYWQNVVAQPSQALPLDFAISARSQESVYEELVSNLTKQETQVLLQEALSAYRLQINDILLTALAQTLAVWTGGQAWLLDMEGHGREYLQATAIDLARTVGWFTTVFPVRLELSTHEPSATLKSIKEQLRQIPNKGIGYGLLRYIEQAPELSINTKQAQISFNYLGQLDVLEKTSSMPQEALIVGFASEASGIALSTPNSLDYLLDINAMVVAGCLRIHWGYRSDCHEATTIQQLADDFTQHLKTLIAHCQQTEAVAYTASDFSQAGLQQEQLDKLLMRVKKPRRSKRA